MHTLKEKFSVLWEKAKELPARLAGRVRNMSERGKRAAALCCAALAAVALCAGVGRAAWLNGYGQGYAVGTAAGIADGQAQGYEEGRTAGYDEGRTAGYNEGRNEGYIQGKDTGYENGYTAGYSAAVDEISAAVQMPDPVEPEPQAPAQQPQEQPGEEGTGKYVLNTRTKIVHEDDCLFVEMIRKKDRQYTGDLSAALDAGYSKCPVCSPD